MNIQSAKFNRSGLIDLITDKGNFVVPDDENNSMRKLIDKQKVSIEPFEISLDEIKQEANQTVEQSHAEFLRNLTGNATIEERNTWQSKALACEAILNGTASEIQIEMIATEAQIVGEEIETLITKILTRYGSYQKLIGLVSGLKRKTQATIDQCTTKEQIDQVLEQSSQKQINTFNNGCKDNKKCHSPNLKPLSKCLIQEKCIG